MYNEEKDKIVETILDTLVPTPFFWRRMMGGWYIYVGNTFIAKVMYDLEDVLTIGPFHNWIQQIVDAIYDSTTVRAHVLSDSEYIRRYMHADGRTASLNVLFNSMGLRVQTDEVGWLIKKNHTGFMSGFKNFFDLQSIGLLTQTMRTLYTDQFTPAFWETIRSEIERKYNVKPFISPPAPKMY